MYKAQMDKESHRAQYSENLLIQLTGLFVRMQPRVTMKSFDIAEYMQTVTFSTAHSSDKAQQVPPPRLSVPSSRLLFFFFAVVWGLDIQ